MGGANCWYRCGGNVFFHAYLCLLWFTFLFWVVVANVPVGGLSVQAAEEKNSARNKAGGN